MTQNLGVLDLILIDLILTKVLFVKLINTKKITINTKKLLTDLGNASDLSPIIS